MSLILHGSPKKTVESQSLGRILFDSLEKEDWGRTALINAHTGASLTCHELLNESIRLAANYKQLGVKKGDIVAIVFENDPIYAIPLLAALFIDATVQPISPTWTLRELMHAFEVSKPKWVVSGELALNKAKEAADGVSSTVIPFKEMMEEAIPSKELLDKTELLKLEDLSPTTVAFVFSSSGTTGLPKGVLLTHQSIVTTIQYWREERFGNFQKGNATVVAAPLHHLLGMHMLLLSLVSSVKLVMINKFSADLFLKSIENYRANKLVCPPPMVVFLAKSPVVDAYDLSSLREIICGSASLKREVEDSVQKRLNVTLRQTFATTETAGACTMVPRGLSRSGSCGILLPNLLAKVRDPETKQTLGPNEKGELCFKGPVLMKGYANNPKATKDAFDGDGFYCTGDVGYYDDDGYFFIVGRLKELIKYKAFQVAPAELEDVLLSHPLIGDAAVIGIPDERSGELPYGFIVKQLKGNNSITAKEILAYVSDRVSPEKRLHGVSFLDEIPKNNGGKIKRQFLKDVYSTTYKSF